MKFKGSVQVNRWRLFWASVIVVALVGGGAFYCNFTYDIAEAKARVQQGSQVFESRFGPMEYAVAGNGPLVIMIHGTGGGFDQGLAFSSRLVAAGHKIVAPSRFGYLRTAFPADPSSENQADAIVDLMDELGIARAPVIGGSAGALSAIQFAIRHPDRCSALVLIVPATYVPNKEPMRPNALGAAIMQYGLKSDFLFWAGTQVAEETMINTLLATDRDVFRNAPPDEQNRVRAILHDILPVSARYMGTLNDAKLAGTPSPMELAAIKVPTLAISLEDDRFETFAAAKHIAQTVPGAKLISYPTGGHVFVGHEAEAYKEVDSFLTALAKP
jgi:2-hydroxy-6-oxonona-2,4-dienedioate hydrolase